MNATWDQPSDGEARWPASVAILFAILLQGALPARLAIVHAWLLVPLEGVALLVLILVSPRRIKHRSRRVRRFELVLVGAMTLSNSVAAVRLVRGLVVGTEGADPAKLLLTAASIWLTNVVLFAFWYWAFDRGGPSDRAHGIDPFPDFVFPQMQALDLAGPGWAPEFVDYLFLSFTNATAFSPTDTMPFTRWAKSLMMVQSSVSLITVGLSVARAVNVLG